MTLDKFIFFIQSIYMFCIQFIIIISWKHFFCKEKAETKTKMCNKTIDLEQKLVIKIREA